MSGPTTAVETTTTGEMEVTTDEENATIPSTSNGVTGKSIADLEQELQDLENQYEEYNEYNLPDDEKVMGGKAATATTVNSNTLVTLKNVKTESISRATPIVSAQTSLGPSITKRRPQQGRLAAGKSLKFGKSTEKPSSEGVSKPGISAKATKSKGRGKP